MALQPLLATLVIATLGLTAYVSSVTREVRQVVAGRSLYAQETTTPPATTAPATQQPTAVESHPPGQGTPPPGGYQGFQGTGSTYNGPGPQDTRWDGSNQQGPGGPGGYPGGPGGQGMMSGPGMGPGRQGNFGGGPGGMMGGQQGQMGPGGFGGHEGFGPGGPGMMGGPGGPGGFQGPSEEDMQRMQEQQNAQCRKQIARDASRMEKDMFRGINMMIKQLERRKVPVPADVQQGIETLKGLIEKMKNIEACEDMSEIGPQIGEIMQPLMEKLQAAMMLGEIPRMKKEIDHEIKRVQKDWSRTKNRIARRPEAAEYVGQCETIVGQLTTLRDQTFATFDQALAAGDPEIMESAATNGEQAMELMEDLQRCVSTAVAVSQASREIKKFEQEYKKFSRLGKKDEEVAACLPALQSAIDEGKQLTSSKADMEDLLGAFDAGYQAVEHCNEAAGIEKDFGDRYGGEGSDLERYVPQGLGNYIQMPGQGMGGGMGPGGPGMMGPPGGMGPGGPGGFGGGPMMGGGGGFGGF